MKDGGAASAPMWVRGTRSTANSVSFCECVFRERADGCAKTGWNASTRPRMKFGEAYSWRVMEGTVNWAPKVSS